MKCEELKLHGYVACVACRVVGPCVENPPGLDETASRDVNRSAKGDYEAALAGLSYKPVWGVPLRTNREDNEHE